MGSALEMLLFSFAIADQFKFRIHQEFGMRLKAEEDLKELNQQLEIKIIEKTNEAFKNEKRAVLGEMAGSIAHELNSPLTAVHSGVDRLTMLLNKPEFDKEKLNKTNNRIKGVMEKIFRITKSLQMYGTDVSRDEFHEFSAKEIMNDAIEYCKDSFDFSKFTFKLDTQLDKIYCQKRAITQAVATLLKLRLSLLETNNGDMRLEIKGDDKYSYLNFHDSAGEIPEWIVDFITNPHSKLNGENKGSGLELTLLRDIIEKHKALIQFNKTEIDLRITIKLPISN